MTIDEIQAYLQEQIPLSRAMGIEITKAAHTQVILSLPLEPNINHRDTAFGGSISAAGTLACWTLVHLRLSELDMHTRLVIHKHKMVYRRPIAERFEATCTFNDDTAWQQVLDMLERWGKAKLQLKASITCAGDVAADFHGSFVVTTE
ncbi:MAG: YiiD C-terminal domain-containing protein [Phycisphaeraceae bacterium]|nr:YiiD C-terminal domain-containing protein [Phycisphaeraceae bacterium]